MGIASDLSLAAESADKLDQLEAIKRTLWQAWGAGALDDATATTVDITINARRSALVGGLRPFAPTPLPAIKVAMVRATDVVRLDTERRQNRRARRALVALRGRLPAELAAELLAIRGGFGILAVLSTIGAEIARHGICSAFIDQLAAWSGTSRSTVKRALRRARAAGLLDVQERRRRGQRSASNVLRLAATKAAEQWRRWLARRGRKQPSAGGVGSNPDPRSRYQNKIHGADPDFQDGDHFGRQRWRPAPA